MPYPGYQTVKIGDTTYVSSTKFKNHATASRWISALIEHLGADANEIRGKPRVVNKQPSDAEVYPED